MSLSSVSVRLSIRWLPDAASEPTDTLVLTGSKTGVFLDVRFLKEKPELDWAFAGYRRMLPDQTVKFEHCIDSRTLNAVDVIDIGRNGVLEGGETLEVGEMVNPDTGRMTAYEEIWAEKQVVHPALEGGAVFVANKARTVWRARVGEWQLAMGRRREDGGFWACQAEWIWNEDEKDGRWVVRRDVGCEGMRWLFLPVVGAGESESWREGECVVWDGDVWDVIERDG